MKLKLSEAIRAGIPMAPQQGTHDLYVNGRACALGTAMLGVGLKPDEISYSTMHENFPVVLQKLDPPPALKEKYPYLGNPDVFDVVTVLNDIERWSRENIADYLETKGL